MSTEARIRGAGLLAPEEALVCANCGAGRERQAVRSYAGGNHGPRTFRSAGVLACMDCGHRTRFSRSIDPEEGERETVEPLGIPGEEGGDDE